MIDDSHEDGAFLPEGVESPPPMVKTMAIVRWGLLAGLTIFALFMFLSMPGLALWEARGDQQVQYHCPMHPTYIANQPGECPICGMSLVPVKGQPAERKTPSKADDKTKTMKDSSATMQKYTCPMHPEVISDKPGQCPKCGMDLIAATHSSHDSTRSEPKVRTDTTGRKKAAEGYYTCPMHPEVVSDKPGRCPKCGMFLEYKQAADSLSEHGTHPADTVHDASTAESQIPGLAPITLELARQQLIGVRTSKAVRETIGDSLRLFGELTVDETKLRKLQLRVSGWIKKLFLNQTGQAVDRGDTIALIYSPELYQAMSEFKNLLNSPLMESSPQIRAATREKLILLGLSDADIDEIEEGTEPTPDYALRSPLRGFVIEKNVIEGQRIDPTQEIATIADLSTVWVLAGVYEHDIPYIKTGQRAEVKIEGFPDLIFKGRIGLIYPDFSLDSRSGKVRIELSNEGFRLRPGMLAEINVAADSKSLLTVPSEAVIDGGVHRYVFVVHDKTHFEPRLVTTGISIGERTAIETGLREGEEVVTSANFLIDSEGRLKAAMIGSSGPPPTTHEGHK